MGFETGSQHVMLHEVVPADSRNYEASMAQRLYRWMGMILALKLSINFQLLKRGGFHENSWMSA
jgi:hypothetical protein